MITTNFDRLIENAMREAGVEPTIIASDDAVVGATPLVQTKCMVIKVHGDYLDARIKNTDAELEKYSPRHESVARSGVRQLRPARGGLVGRMGHGAAVRHPARSLKAISVLLGCARRIGRLRRIF